MMMDERKIADGYSLDRNNNNNNIGVFRHKSPNFRQNGERKEKPADKETINEGMVKVCDRIVAVKDRKRIAQLFAIGPMIGRGRFAVVFAAVEKTGHDVFALKQVDKQKVLGKRCFVENEVHLLSQCDHENICKLKSAFQSPTTYFLLCEFAQGDLFELITKSISGRLSEALAAHITAQVASGLSYLRDRKIVHRDIKPENVLFNEELTVKIADFGLACVVLGPLFRVCGTPSYVAPEVLAEYGYGLAVDVWSLGVIVHVMLVGYAPFRCTHRSRLFRLIMRGQINFEMPIWKTISTGARELLARMLTRDERRRVSPEAISSDTWIRECRDRFEINNNQ